MMILLSSPVAGRRLKLVTPQSEDDNAVSELRSDPKIREYLPFLPEHFSVEEARERREKQMVDERTLDFHIHGTDPETADGFLGTCGLSDINPVNKSAEAGILLVSKVHRSGLGTEAIYCLLSYAFDNLKLHRIVFETGCDNVPMRNWFEILLGVQVHVVYCCRTPSSSFHVLSQSTN